VDAVAMGEGIVVFDRAGTKVHVLNPAAARVFSACGQGLSRMDLVGLLHHASGESSDRLATDVDAALDQNPHPPRPDHQLLVPLLVRQRSRIQPAHQHLEPQVHRVPLS
jgi:hypothetical protein